jgi:hypothetical protein
VDKSIALAAYYKQIKDRETERKFIEVKLRAWRRIAEIFKETDFSDCDNNRSKQIRKIRAVFPIANDMSNKILDDLICLARMSKKDFEQTLKYPNLTGAMGNFFNNTSYARRQQAKFRREDEKFYATEEGQKTKREEEAYKKQIEEDIKFHHDLVAAGKEANEEIGITLERHDRFEMKTIAFIIRYEIYKVLRQAAFDHKITMHEIMRRSLRAWFTTHGYEYPSDTKTKEPA